ncbi:MAG: hypothetical protein FD169_263 [Bacillota bacterium]|nr:MAG: hypothetical protein FD169_263 [Bacillota bacterium]
MSKLLKAFLVVALLWVLVVGAGYFAWGHFQSFVPRLLQINERAEGTETITRVASDITNISVDTRNGSVTVVATEGADIVINVFYTAQGNSVANANDRLKALRTEVSTTGTTMSVEGIYPSTTINNQSIRYEIAIPKSLNLKIRTSNGRINVEEIVGKVDLYTSNGTIDVVSQVGPEELLVYTSNGKINVAAAPTGGTYNLRTSNGTVTVSLPEDLGVSFKATTSNGSIDLGYGQWSFVGGQLTNKNVTAQLGDGSLDLDIQTSNGSIKLTKRE